MMPGVRDDRSRVLNWGMQVLASLRIQRFNRLTASQMAPTGPEFSVKRLGGR